MERTKDYARVECTPTALQKIVETFKDIVKDPAKASFGSLRGKWGQNYFSTSNMDWPA
jgi:hypothetical protein